jgi:hypothetical protein
VGDRKGVSLLFGEANLGPFYPFEGMFFYYDLLHYRYYRAFLYD